MEKFKHNGESHKALMELVVNEIRENRQECKDIMNILRKGEGKIAGNTSAIKNLKWSFITAMTIIISIIGWTVFGG